MTFKKYTINSIQLSLNDLVGKAYTNAVCEARAFVENRDKRALHRIAESKVDFAPMRYVWLMDGLIDYVGQQICDSLPDFASGTALLTEFGFVRIGQDGRVYLCATNERWQHALGHSFPGYKLIEHAQQIGISNTTHSDQRGRIARLVEQKSVRMVNEIANKEDEQFIQAIGDSLPYLLPGSQVTNSQGELASLARLITITFVYANKTYISTIGDDYHAALNALAGTYPAAIDRIKGYRHLSSILFHSVEAAAQFVTYLAQTGIDIGAHTHTTGPSPAILTKIPLIATPKMVEFLISKMNEALEQL